MDRAGKGGWIEFEILVIAAGIVDLGAIFPTVCRVGLIAEGCVGRSGMGEKK